MPGPHIVTSALCPHPPCTNRVQQTWGLVRLKAIHVSVASTHLHLLTRLHCANRVRLQFSLYQLPGRTLLLCRPPGIC